MTLTKRLALSLRDGPRLVIASALVAFIPAPPDGASGPRRRIGPIGQYIAGTRIAEDRKVGIFADIAGRPRPWRRSAAITSDSAIVPRAPTGSGSADKPGRKNGGNCWSDRFPPRSTWSSCSSDGRCGFELQRAGDRHTVRRAAASTTQFRFQAEPQNPGRRPCTCASRPRFAGFRARIYSEKRLFRGGSRYWPFLWFIYGMMFGRGFLLLLFLYNRRAPISCSRFYRLHTSSPVVDSGVSPPVSLADWPYWANASCPSSSTWLA